MGIPVTVHLDAATFNRLERIADARGMSMRDLIVQHLTQGLEPTLGRIVTAKGKPVRTQDVTEWVRAAELGITNRLIAERWGVSEQLVSRLLRERGVRRQKPHSNRQEKAA